MNQRREKANTQFLQIDFNENRSNANPHSNKVGPLAATAAQMLAFFSRLQKHILLLQLHTDENTKLKRN